MDGSAFLNWAGNSDLELLAQILQKELQKAKWTKQQM